MSRGYFEKLGAGLYSKVSIFCVKITPLPGQDVGSGSGPVPVFQNNSGYPATPLNNKGLYHNIILYESHNPKKFLFCRFQ